MRVMQATLLLFVLLFPSIHMQKVYPASYEVSQRAIQLDGSTVNGLCSEYINSRMICNAPRTGVLFDDIIPSQIFLHGHYWASELLTIRASSFAITFNFNYHVYGIDAMNNTLEIRSVQVVLLNCPPRGISVADISIWDVSSTPQLITTIKNILSSCENFVKVCFDLNTYITSQQIALKFRGVNNSIYLAEISFYRNVEQCSSANASVMTSANASVMTSANASVMNSTTTSVSNRDAVNTSSDDFSLASPTFSATNINVSTSLTGNCCNSNATPTAIIPAFFAFIAFIVFIVFTILILLYLKKRLLIKNSTVNIIKESYDKIHAIHSVDNIDHTKEISENIKCEDNSNPEYDYINIQDQYRTTYCKAKNSPCLLTSNSEPNITNEQSGQDLSYHDNADPSLLSPRFENVTVISPSDSESNLKVKNISHYNYSDNTSATIASDSFGNSTALYAVIKRSESEGQLNHEYHISMKRKGNEILNLSCDNLYNILNEHMTPVIPVKSEELLDELEEVYD